MAPARPAILAYMKTGVSTLPLGGVDGGSFIESLSNFPQLKFLSLRYTELDDRAAEAFQEHLKYTPLLSHLDLNGNKLTMKGFGSLGMGLQKMSRQLPSEFQGEVEPADSVGEPRLPGSLKYLDLGSTELSASNNGDASTTQEDLEKLAHGIANQPSLMYLNLSGFGRLVKSNSDLLLLSSQLKTLKKLDNLDLSKWNFVGNRDQENQVIGSFASVLGELGELTTLNLEGAFGENRSKDQPLYNLDSIGQTLVEKNKKLKQLNILNLSPTKSFYSFIRKLELTSLAVGSISENKSTYSEVHELFSRLNYPVVPSDPLIASLKHLIISNDIQSNWDSSLTGIVVSVFDKITASYRQPTPELKNSLETISILDSRRGKNLTSETTLRKTLKTFYNPVTLKTLRIDELKGYGDWHYQEVEKEIKKCPHLKFRTYPLWYFRKNPRFHRYWEYS
jgi:hypothetical protein